MQVLFDEVIAECFANIYMDAASCAPRDDANSLGRYFAYEPFDAVTLHRAGYLLNYVINASAACQQYLHRNVRYLFFRSQS